MKTGQTRPLACVWGLHASHTQPDWGPQSEPEPADFCKYSPIWCVSAWSDAELLQCALHTRRRRSIFLNRSRRISRRGAFLTVYHNCGHAASMLQVMGLLWSPQTKYQQLERSEFREEKKNDTKRENAKRKHAAVIKSHYWLSDKSCVKALRWMLSQ